MSFYTHRRRTYLSQHLGVRENKMASLSIPVTKHVFNYYFYSTRWRLITIFTANNYLFIMTK